MRFAAPLAAWSLAASCLGSCRALDPEVGKFQHACAIESGYDRPEGYDGVGPDPRCFPTAGTAKDECDGCENAKCCDARFDCYDDAVCRCADQTFDECIDLAEERDSADAAAAVASCWSDFASTGAAAKKRADCRRAQCAAECGAPVP